MNMAKRSLRTRGVASEDSARAEEEEEEEEEAAREPPPAARPQSFSHSLSLPSSLPLTRAEEERHTIGGGQSHSGGDVTLEDMRRQAERGGGSGRLGGML